jgi:hypothetical protein
MPRYPYLNTEVLAWNRSLEAHCLLQRCTMVECSYEHTWLNPHCHLLCGERWFNRGSKLCTYCTKSCTKSLEQCAWMHSYCTLRDMLNQGNQISVDKHCYHNLYILQNQVMQFKLEQKEILKCEQHIQRKENLKFHLGITMSSSCTLPISLPASPWTLCQFRATGIWRASKQNNFNSPWQSNLP